MLRKNVLITGGTRGIGKAISDVLQDTDQYRLIVPSRKDMDLSKHGSISNYFDDDNIKVDILINNAGINVLNIIDDISHETVADMLSVNLVAPLQLIQACVPHMKSQKWGRIINMSSIWGVRSKEFRTLY